MAENRFDKLKYASQIVVSYASGNSIAHAELPDLISAVYRALNDLDQPSLSETPLKPAVSVRSSVKRDFITCLECGYQGKMLKRHISSSHGLTPATYRDKWSLNADYPMVAPAYAESRSALAKKIGLGRNSGKRR